MKSTYLIGAFCALVLFTGCATHFDKQLDTFKAVELERSKEGAAKYTALSAIATGADASTKQVALQAWQAVAMVDQFAGGRQREAMPVAPPDLFDRALATLSVLAPITGQVMTANYAKNIAINASNNAATVAMNEATQRTAQLGVVRDTGIGVAGTVGGGYAGALNAALSRPTYQITTNGNGNTVAGGNATSNNVDCPQTASATGGQSGTAGTGGGAPGTTGGASGAGAAPQVTQRTDCVAGR